MKKRPDINMRTLLQQRLEGKTWQELETIWQVSSRTLESFFRRNLVKLKPFFNEQLSK